MPLALPEINKALLPAKLAYFFFYFSFSSVTPYITVFMTAYGLNPEQAGFVLAARLFAQFLSGPLWGGIADKTHKYKFVLVLQIIISSIFTFTAPWMPYILPGMQSSGECHDTISVGPANFSTMTTTGMPFISTKTMISNGHSPNFTKDSTMVPSINNTSFFTGKKKLAQTTGIAEARTTTSTFTNNSSVQLILNNHTVKLNISKKSIPTSKQCASEINKQKLFIVMTVWFALIGAFDGGIPLLIDNSVMETIARLKKSDFGKQRLWGAVGFGLAAFASGVAIELAGGEGPNYFTMFYIYLGSNACLLVVCYFLQMSSPMKPNDELLRAERTDKPNLTKGLIDSFKRFNVSFFFLTVLIMGIANGLLYGFMFIYIEELNGSKIIMGLSILVACSTEVLMFPVSNKFIELIHGNLVAIALAFVTYALRFTGFAFIHNAWLILPLQLLHSICFALFWNAAVYHTTDLAPKGMVATLLGIMNGIFHGFAGGFSSLVGGIAYNHLGGRNLYQGYGILCAAWSIFLIFHILERKKKGKLGKKKERDEEKKKDQRGKDENELDVLQTSEKLLADEKE